LFDNASDVYRIDRKGDPDNLRYRSLHRYSVPAYRRIGHGAVLGALASQKIDKSFPEDKGIVLVEPEWEGRATRSLLQRARAVDQQKLRLVRSGTGRNLDEHSESFIALPPSRKRKRGSESPVAEHGEVDYRSVEGKAKSLQRPDNSDLEYTSTSDDSTEDEDAKAARLRNAELSRRTREQPQDLAAWQRLIEHQRVVLGFAAGDLSVAKTRTLADIRISIYEQALEVVKSAVARAALTLGMLQEGAKFWEAKKLASKWEEALRSYSNDVNIWTAYLNFVQTSYTEFRYERCRDEYVKCLDILGVELKRANGMTKAAELSTVLVYVFLRLTGFMRDAGYHELAEALWQAILELYFFRSAELQGEAAVAEAFEEFWESEVPRIGEEGAKGWLNYSPDQQDSVEPATIEVDGLTSTRRLFTNFSNVEKQAAKKLAHPGKSADEAGEDDPYHIVLFNDLKPILFPHLLRLEAKRDLIIAFIRFLGLPPQPWSLQRVHESWWLDPVLTTQTRSDTFIPHFQITTDTLFADAFANTSLEDAEWARRALHSLIGACPDNDTLAEYFVAFEYYLDPASAAKVAKRLLKTRSSSLRLYNCYAVIEYRNKGLDAGNRIFSTAVSMSDTLDEKQRRMNVLLYRTWVWEALRIRKLQHAIGVLFSIGGGVYGIHEQSFSPAVELRVTRWLKGGRDAMLLAGEAHLAVLHAELLALVAYIHHDKSIQAAFRAYDEMDEILTSYSLSGSPPHEHLHQAKAQLIDFHLKHVHIWQPALIRDTLANSIKLFPNNTMVLAAYSKTGPYLNLHGSQSLIDDIVLAENKDLVIGWSFAVHATLHCNLPLGGTIHATRATFGRAVSRSAKHNLHIWTSYLLFECEQKDFKKAKDVFMRGLRELPWCKWWVVLGLEKLADVVGFEDAKRIWEVLGERELRVHVDVEELVEEEWRRRQEEVARRALV
jgi:hypothetical protein